jgi:hypothetical protein
MIRMAESQSEGGRNARTISEAVWKLFLAVEQRSELPLISRLNNRARNTERHLVQRIALISMASKLAVAPSRAPDTTLGPRPKIPPKTSAKMAVFFSSFRGASQDAGTSHLCFMR